MELTQVPVWFLRPCELFSAWWRPLTKSLTHDASEARQPPGFPQVKTNETKDS